MVRDDSLEVLEPQWDTNLLAEFEYAYAKRWRLKVNQPERRGQ